MGLCWGWGGGLRSAHLQVPPRLTVGAKEQDRHRCPAEETGPHGGGWLLPGHTATKKPRWPANENPLDPRVLPSPHGSRRENWTRSPELCPESLPQLSAQTVPSDA